MISLSQTLHTYAERKKDFYKPDFIRAHFIQEKFKCNKEKFQSRINLCNGFRFVEYSVQHFDAKIKKDKANERTKSNHWKF